MIFVKDWAEICLLHRAEEIPIRAIERHLGISKNTVNSKSPLTDGSPQLAADLLTTPEPPFTEQALAVAAVMMAMSCRDGERGWREAWRRRW